jgi:hypothetical protein
VKVTDSHSQFDMPYAEMMAQVSKREGSFRQRAVEHAEV